MKKIIVLSIMCLMSLAINAQKYVDLGLPSGTLWKTVNEKNPKDEYNLYTYEEALEKYGDKLPTYEQLEELSDNCKWTWDSTKNGCIVVGPNGKSIFLPAVGKREPNGHFWGKGDYGLCWSFSPYKNDIVYAWAIRFYPSEESSGITYMTNGLPRLDWLSVRLVKKR